MCGISGVLRWDGRDDGRAVEAMTHALWHRGPDAGAVVRSGPVILGHRRLAIIDLDPASNQPMAVPELDLLIAFNGEIYNFEDLRAEIEATGWRFRTKGDTEVILAAYARWGEGCVARLEGMFAFALWDGRTRKLLLARDRMGKKPLFLTRLGDGGVAFASELKALRLHPDVGREIDRRALSQYLALNYVLSDACLLRGVEKLPAAHYMVIEPGRPIRVSRYWDLAAFFKRKRRFASHEAAAEELNALLSDAVRARLMSDVPLGSFLSGGIDSTAIVAAMCRLRDPRSVLTYSIGFREKSYSELPEARMAADSLGVRHHDMLVEPDMATAMPQIAAITDEPFADSSIIPFYYLAQFARRSVAVCLSGDGGDELFAGYETYLADRFHQGLSWLPSPVIRAAAAAIRAAAPVSFDKVSLDYKLRRFVTGLALPFPQAHQHWRTIFDPAERQVLLGGACPEDEGAFSSVASFFGEMGGCHILDQAMYVDIKTWLVDDILVKVDRATMAHSLEARAPFLDRKVVEFAASLPVDLKLRGLTKKYLLKRSQMALVPSGVPGRRKQGFNAPVSHWLKGSVHDLARQVTLDTSRDSLLDRAVTETLWREHAAGKADHGLKLFGLLNLGLWLDGLRQGGS